MWKHNKDHHGRETLTLPWYLILSGCCWKKAELVVPPPRLVLLLLCHTDSSTVTSHRAFNKTSHLLLLLSLLIPLSLSLRLQVSFSTSSLLLIWLPCEEKALTSVQSSNSSSCLHLQFISPLTGQRNACLSTGPSPSL